MPLSNFVFDTVDHSIIYIVFLHWESLEQVWVSLEFIEFSFIPNNLYIVTRIYVFLIPLFYFVFM